MTAKEYLRNLRKLDLEIKTLRTQIKQLRAEAEGLKSMELSDMPRGGKSPDMADIVAEVADLQMLCAQYVSELVAKKQEAMNSIMRIEGSELRTVLLLRYLQCMEWDDIAERMQYSARTIFSLHGAALTEFEQVYEQIAVNCSNLQ